MEKWPVNTLKNKFKEQHMSFEQLGEEPFLVVLEFGNAGKNIEPGCMWEMTD